MKNKQTKYIQIDTQKPQNKALTENLQKIQERTGLSFRHAIFMAVAEYANKVTNT